MRDAVATVVEAPNVSLIYSAKLISLEIAKTVSLGVIIFILSIDNNPKVEVLILAS